MPRFFIILLIFGFMLTGCYSSPPEAIEHATDQISANKRHASNPKLDARAQLIGQVNEDQWHVQRHMLDPNYVIPAAVQARRAQARKARGE